MTSPAAAPRLPLAARGCRRFDGVRQPPRGRWPYRQDREGALGASRRQY